MSGLLFSLYVSALNWILTASPLLCARSASRSLCRGKVHKGFFFFGFFNWGGVRLPLPLHGSKGGGGIVHLLSISFAPPLPLSHPMSPSLLSPLSLTTFNFIHPLIPPLPARPPTASMALHLPPTFYASLLHAFLVHFCIKPILIFHKLHAACFYLPTFEVNLHWHFSWHQKMQLSITLEIKNRHMQFIFSSLFSREICTNSFGTCFPKYLNLKM